MTSILSENLKNTTLGELQQRAATYTKSGGPYAIGSLAISGLATWCNLTSVSGTSSLIGVFAAAKLGSDLALQNEDRFSFWGKVARGALVTAIGHTIVSLVDPNSSLGGSPDSIVKKVLVGTGVAAHVALSTVLIAAGVFYARAYIRPETPVGLVDKKTFAELDVELETKTKEIPGVHVRHFSGKTLGFFVKVPNRSEEIDAVLAALGYQEAFSELGPSDNRLFYKDCGDSSKVWLQLDVGGSPK